MKDPVYRWAPIALFFAAAYLISWTCWSILFGYHLSHLQGVGFSIYLIAVLAPHVSAVMAAAWEGGAVGIRRFYLEAFRSLTWIWIMIALWVPVAIYLTRYGLGLVLDQTGGASIFHAAPRTLFVLLFGQFAVAVGEEPGWRGFALVRLTRRLGVIPGSIFLGVAWALWHLPLFLIPGTAQYGTSFAAFMTTLVAWSLVVTYIVRRAGGSTIAAMLFHFSANVCDFVVWDPASTTVALLPWLLAAAISSWKLRHDQPAMPPVDSPARPVRKTRRLAASSKMN